VPQNSGFFYKSRGSVVKFKQLVVPWLFPARAPKFRSFLQFRMGR
jgi:hypothetical protein